MGGGGTVQNCKTGLSLLLQEEMMSAACLPEPNAAAIKRCVSWPAVRQPAYTQHETIQESFIVCFCKEICPLAHQSHKTFSKFYKHLTGQQRMELRNVFLMLKQYFMDGWLATGWSCMDGWPQAEAAWMVGHRLKLRGWLATGWSCVDGWPQA